MNGNKNKYQNIVKVIIYNNMAPTNSNIWSVNCTKTLTAADLYWTETFYLYINITIK